MTIPIEQIPYRFAFPVSSSIKFLVLKVYGLATPIDIASLTIPAILNEILRISSSSDPGSAKAKPPISSFYKKIDFSSTLIELLN